MTILIGGRAAGKEVKVPDDLPPRLIQPVLQPCTVVDVVNESVPFHVEHYTLRWFYFPGDMRLWFYAQADMSDVEVFAHLIQHYRPPEPAA